MPKPQESDRGVRLYGVGRWECASETGRQTGASGDSVSSSCYTTMVAVRPFIVCSSITFTALIFTTLTALYFALAEVQEVQVNVENQDNVSEKHINHRHKRGGSNNYRTIYRWKQVEYELPPTVRVERMKSQGRYIPSNVYISDIKIYNDTMYLAMPRLKSGVPITLGYLPLYMNDSFVHNNDVISPFPDYKLNIEQNCDGFKSVTSLEIDPDGIMWVVDNGEANMRHHRSNSASYCLPSLKLIDLNNYFSYINYDFPEDVVGSNYYLKSIVVDDHDGGYAYITDNSKVEPGIIVYSRRENRSWKFTHMKTMIADRPQSLLNTIDSSDNIDGISLGSRFNTSDGITDRFVFYSALGSYNLYAVRASWLRDESSVSKPFESQLVGNKNDFSDGMITDEYGYVYYGGLLNRSIYRWNCNKNFSDGVEVVAFNRYTFYWIEKFAFDERNNLYALVTRFGEFAMETIDVRKYNYKIIRIDVNARSYFYDGSSKNQEEATDAPSANGVSKGDWLFSQICALFILVLFKSSENV